MAQWTKKLTLTPEWGKALDGEISAQNLAKIVSERIIAMGEYDSEEVEESRLELSESFKSFSEDPDTTIDDLDDLMSDLYNWADTPLDSLWNGKKVAWVETF